MAASIGSITVKLKLDSEEFERDVRALVQTPSIGRTVHYRSYGTPGGEYLPEPRAAIITCVYDDVAPDLADEAETYAGLCVLNPTGMFFNQLVPFSEEPKPGHWSWPPRV